MRRRGQRDPKAERYGYKGIEFSVQPSGPNEWKWATYPTKVSGIPAKRGKLSGTREEADAACKAAIEQAFPEESARLIENHALVKSWEADQRRPRPGSATARLDQSS